MDDGIINPRGKRSLSLFLQIAFFCLVFAVPAYSETKAFSEEGADLAVKVNDLDKRMVRVEAILEQMNERLNHFGDRLLNIETKMDAKFAQMDAKFDQVNTIMDTKFMWIIGIIIGMWVTIMLAIAGLFVTIILSSRRKT